MMTTGMVMQLAEALHDVDEEHAGVTSRAVLAQLDRSLTILTEFVASAEAGRMDPEGAVFLRALAECGQTWKPDPELAARLGDVKRRALEIVTR